jgi:hypothetical protein
MLFVVQGESVDAPVFNHSNGPCTRRMKKPPFWSCGFRFLKTMLGYAAAIGVSVLLLSAPDRALGEELSFDEEAIVRSGALREILNSNPCEAKGDRWFLMGQRCLRLVKSFHPRHGEMDGVALGEWGLETIDRINYFSDSPGSFYRNSSRKEIIFNLKTPPPINDGYLIIEERHDFEPHHDFGYVELKDNSSPETVNVATLTGKSERLQTIERELPALASFSLVLRSASDESDTRDGWLVKGVRIYEQIPVSCASQGVRYKWRRDSCQLMTLEEAKADCLQNSDSWYWNGAECQAYTLAQRETICRSLGAEWKWSEAGCVAQVFHEQAAPERALTLKSPWGVEQINGNFALSDSPNVLYREDINAKTDIARIGVKRSTDLTLTLEHLYDIERYGDHGFVTLRPAASQNNEINVAEYRGTEKEFKNNKVALSSHLRFAETFVLGLRLVSDDITESNGWLIKSMKVEARMPLRCAAEGSLTGWTGERCEQLTQNQQQQLCALDPVNFVWQGSLCTSRPVNEKEQLCQSRGETHAWDPADGTCRLLTPEERRERCQARGAAHRLVGEECRELTAAEQCRIKGDPFRLQNGECRELSQEQLCQERGFGYAVTGGKCTLMSERERREACLALAPYWKWVGGSCRELPEEERRQICMDQGEFFSWQDGSCRKMTEDEQQQLCAQKGYRYIWNGGTSCEQRPDEQLEAGCRLHGAAFSWDGERCVRPLLADAAESLQSVDAKGTWRLAEGYEGQAFSDMRETAATSDKDRELTFAPIRLRQRTGVPLLSFMVAHESYNSGVYLIVEGRAAGEDGWQQLDKVGWLSQGFSRREVPLRSLLKKRQGVEWIQVRFRLALEGEFSPDQVRIDEIRITDALSIDCATKGEAAYQASDETCRLKSQEQLGCESQMDAVWDENRCRRVAQGELSQQCQEFQGQFQYDTAAGQCVALGFEKRQENCSLKGPAFKWDGLRCRPLTAEEICLAKGDDFIWREGKCLQRTEREKCLSRGISYLFEAESGRCRELSQEEADAVCRKKGDEWQFSSSVGCMTLLYKDDAETMQGRTVVGEGWGLEASHDGMVYSDSPEGLYPNNSNTKLILPAFAILAKEPIWVEFQSWEDIETNFDSGEVILDIADDRAGIALAKITGTQPEWRLRRLSSPHNGILIEKARLQLVFTSDSSGNQQGWKVDDIKVSAVAPLDCANKGDSYYFTGESCQPLSNEERSNICRLRGGRYYWAVDQRRCMRRTVTEYKEYCDALGDEYRWENETCRKLNLEERKQFCQSRGDVFVFENGVCRMMSAKEMCDVKGPDWIFDENVCRPLTLEEKKQACTSRGFGYVWQNDKCTLLSVDERIKLCHSLGPDRVWREGRCDTYKEYEKCWQKDDRWQWDGQKCVHAMNFFDYCESKEQPAAVVMQIKLLKQYVAAENCSEAAQRLSSLTRLNLTSSELTDLRVVATLKQLQKLSLTKNQLTSLTQLRSLVVMDTLRVDSNRLQNLEGVESFVALRLLSAWDNPLTQVGSLCRSSTLNQIYLASGTLTARQKEELIRCLPVSKIEFSNP